MKPLIVALDVDTDQEALSLVKATRRHADLFKVGPTLVLRYGPAIFAKIKKLGGRIFLDMKFHDIPNTMKRSVEEAARNGLFSATVHASAGESALRAASALKRRPKIWGVTVLTSFSDEDLSQIGLAVTPAEQVRRLATLAQRAGLDGVVASVEEAAALRAALGPKIDLVTPGIRLPGNEVGDQKRVATPACARAAGATYMVVGRPIIEAKNPAAAAAAILKDWKTGSGKSESKEAIK